MDKKYLENQVSTLVNLYNSQRYNDVVLKGKILIRKFPNQLIFYNVTALSLELQNDIKWTPYTTVGGALSATNANTSMYPSSFSLSKKILSGSITAYLTNVNASEAQTWNNSAQIQIKAGNGLSGSSFRGFNFGPATCSYTNRANTGDVFLHSYD